MQGSPQEWFCALLDTASEVYFRYSLEPPRGFAYLSPSVEALTGHPSSAFQADRDLCLRLVATGDRRLLRRMLRARRSVTTTLHVVRSGVTLPVEVRTVALVKRRKIVAIEGVARLAVSLPSPSGAPVVAGGHDEPVQQRLAALMFEVHDLLHRVLPAARPDAPEAPRILRLGDLALDAEQLTATECGQPVALTTREAFVLRYILQRPGRIITRQQLLTDVWSYIYTGDDRTVDVHMSRLRRKLPSLRERLIAVRGIGYRLDVDGDEKRAVG
jgi:hypothetical protein